MKKSYSDAATKEVVYCYDGDTSATHSIVADAAVGLGATSWSCAGAPSGAASLNLKGKMTRVKTEVSESRFESFNEIGLPLVSKQAMASGTYGFEYAYNLLGGLTEMQYPTGRRVTYTYDTSARPVSATSGTSSYASGVTYHANGAVDLMTLGNGAVSGDTAVDTRMRLTSMAWTKGGTNLLTLGYGYHANGNVSTQEITSRDKGKITQTYEYDAVNRIISVQEGTVWTQEFGYDRYGNRSLLLSSTYNPTPSDLTSTAARPPDPWVLGGTLETGPYVSATNRWNLAEGSYDASGNLTRKLGAGSATSSYDAENRLVKVTGVGGKDVVYEYDGEGRRVRRIVCATGADPCSTGTLDAVTTVFVYDAAGQLAAEYGGGGTAAAGTRYLLSDALGSTRMVLDGTGSAEKCTDYTPFGTEIEGGTGGRDTGCYGDPTNPAASPDATSLKFTGKERDAETGLDYFGARHFSGAQGRFTSPDPIWVKADRMLDPQRLNLYAYGRNNPLKYSDPTGMDVVLGACASNMTISMCQAAATNGLSKEERSHVRWVQGDGKNGFKKGQWGLQVDSNYKSSSKNFANLQSAANSKDGTAVINVVAPHSAIPTLVGVKQGGQTALQPFRDYMAKQLAGTGVKPGENYVSGAEEAFGQTLFPAVGATAIPDVLYAPGSNTQMYLAADTSPAELTATFFHELVHIVLGDFGRTIPKSGHGFGTVNQQTKAAEDAARANYGK